MVFVVTDTSKALSFYAQHRWLVGVEIQTRAKRVENLLMYTNVRGPFGSSLRLESIHTTTRLRNNRNNGFKHSPYWIYRYNTKLPKRSKKTTSGYYIYIVCIILYDVAA